MKELFPKLQFSIVSNLCLWLTSCLGCIMLQVMSCVSMQELFDANLFIHWWKGVLCATFSGSWLLFLTMGVFIQPAGGQGIPFGTLW